MPCEPGYPCEDQDARERERLVREAHHQRMEVILEDLLRSPGGEEGKRKAARMYREEQERLRRALEWKP